MNYYKLICLDTLLDHFQLLLLHQSDVLEEQKRYYVIIFLKEHQPFSEQHVPALKKDKFCSEERFSNKLK